MTTINDLPYEVLSYIMILLVQSSDGAVNLARALPICRKFFEFAEDINILKAVVFCDARLSEYYPLFQQTHGLVIKCVEAGNVSAQFLLAKIIMMSSSQLFVMEVRKVGLASIARGHALIGQFLAGNIRIDDPQAGSFMAYFEPDQGSTASQKGLVHYQLVKSFLRQCNPHDLSEMTIYLSCYINYFTRPNNHDIFPLHKAVDSMRTLATRVKSMEELREIKERLDDCFRVLKEFSTLDNGAGVICCDDPWCSPSKRKAFEEAVGRRHRFEQAASRCGVNMTALMSKSEQVGVDWRELLDEEGKPFEELTEEVCNQFEESRANAVFAFEHYFL